MHITNLGSSRAGGVRIDGKNEIIKAQGGTKRRKVRGGQGEDPMVRRDDRKKRIEEEEWRL